MERRKKTKQYFLKSISGYSVSEKSRKKREEHERELERFLDSEQMQKYYKSVHLKLKQTKKKKKRK